MRVSAFDIISGRDVGFDKVCTVRQPRLSLIREVGMDVYQKHLQIMLYDVRDFIKSYTDAPQSDVQGELDIEVVKSLLSYDILMADDISRDMLLQALSFFICEPISYKPEMGAIAVIHPDEHIEFITRNNLDDIRCLILHLSGIDSASIQTQPKKFKNEKAKNIYEKIEKCKKKAQALSGNDNNYSLPNIIGAVACHHPSHNLSNIWDLTVCQLYDQYKRLDVRSQTAIIGQRWAAWGTEDFDFSIWLKPALT